MPKRTDISKILIIGSGPIRKRCMTLGVILFATQVSFATTCVGGKSFKVHQVCGVVTDSYGATISQAKVVIDSLDGKVNVAEATTDSEGKFSIHKLKAGKYLIRAKYIGFAEAIQPFEVSHPSSKSVSCDKPIEIFLRPGGSCSGVKNAFKNHKN